VSYRVVILSSVNFNHCSIILTSHRTRCLIRFIVSTLHIGLYGAGADAN